MNVNACIACDKDRETGSGFCTEHKEKHAKSLWVKMWRQYQDDIKKFGIKNAAWSPPKKEQENVD